MKEWNGKNGRNERNKKKGTTKSTKNVHSFIISVGILLQRRL